MSRIVVFGTNQHAEGELSSQFDRGWMLGGHPSVSGGGSTTLTVTAAEAAQTFLQFGRMVLVTHPKLPSWGGIIDPPWNATPPISMAVYNVEYLLSLRSPDQPVTLNGSVGSIAAAMIAMCNGQDDLFIRIGDISKADPTSRTKILDGRNYWDQLTTLVQDANCEMQMRAEKSAEGILIIYVDIAIRLGIDTGFLLTDGRNGNAIINEPTLDGPITNRVIGIGSESGVLSRLQTMPYLNESSKKVYRMRSEVVQFQNVREQATLNTYSQNYLNYAAYPRFSATIDVMDKGDAFSNMRLGNLVRARFTNIYLPGGIQGWRGTARILAMAYTEAQNLLSVKVELT